MKILLVYPPFLERRIHAEEIAAMPMGIYYVGAMLKSHGYDVEILNWHAAGGQSAAMRQALAEKKADVIGFSILHANRWGAIDIARAAKEIDPGVEIVFGGIGATVLWRHLLTHFEQIDYVVLGEGEHTFLELVRAFERGRDPDNIAAIPGLALRAPDGPVRTPCADPVADLDRLPPPADYYDFQHLSLTRGCPGRCTFCGSPRFWNRRVRAHSVDYFVNQVETLAARGNNFFFISDDTFTLRPKRVIDVCRRIIDKGLDVTWQAISKVSSVDADMLYWMRKAGCVQISYGVESGSEKIRRLFRKDIGTEQVRRAFDLTVRHGILARAYFIYGAPGETGETIDATLALIRDIKPLSAIFYILDLFPGTQLYEDFKQRTGSTDDIWLERVEDMLYFQSDPDMDQDTVLAFGRRLRNTYHQWLPEFALGLELGGDDSLKAEQADFLSRLGMTFSHGDYAALQTRPDPMTVALELYNRALALHPDARAFWGATLLLRKTGQWRQAETMADQGLVHFPNHLHLNVCRAALYLRQGDSRRALDHLLPFDRAPEALPYLVQCCRSLGDITRENIYRARLAASRR